jgi:hypothetical protein
MSYERVPLEENAGDFEERFQIAETRTRFHKILPFSLRFPKCADCPDYGLTDSNNPTLVSPIVISMSNLAQVVAFRP